MLPRAAACALPLRGRVGEGAPSNVDWTRTCLLALLRPTAQNEIIWAMSMSENREGDPGKEYERNTHRAHVAAYVLIAGLVLELVNAAVWYHGVETLAGIASVALIVGGVWGEVFFANKARLAGDKQLAQYEARTAEAQLALERFRSSRRKDLEGKRDGIVEHLKPFSGTQFDCGMDRTSGEQADFWWDLQPMLIEAGWIHAQWTPPQISNSIAEFTRQGDRPMSGVVAAQNVEIHLHPDRREQLLPAASALVTALSEAGIAAIDAGYNAHNGNNAAIHILIGDKR